MNILFLDDMEDRHELFRQRMFDLGKNVSIKSVWNYDEFVEANKIDGYDYMFLDHDLSHDAIMCDPDNIEEKTGTDVANWIVENIEPMHVAEIIVHSLNPVGRERMVNILNDAGFYAKECPFYYMLTQLR